MSADQRRCRHGPAFVLIRPRMSEPDMPPGTGTARWTTGTCGEAGISGLDLGKLGGAVDCVQPPASLGQTSLGTGFVIAVAELAAQCEGKAVLGGRLGVQACAQGDETEAVQRAGLADAIVVPPVQHEGGLAARPGLA